jgi:hypothetical protein
VLLLTWFACNGKDATTDSADGAECSLVSDPLGTVPATEWNPDLGAAMATYDGLAGRWTADTDCDLGTVGFKFVVRSRDELEVVKEGYPAGLPCGCDGDPAFGTDSDYSPIATFADFEFFVETWDDPGAQSQNVISGGALFDTAAPFQIRACGRMTIDPVLGSQWDTLTTILRVSNGALSGAVILSDDEGQAESCELSGFELVEAL